MSKKISLAILNFSFLIIAFILYISEINFGLNRLYPNIFYVLITLLPVFASLYAVKFLGLKNDMGRGFMFIFLGLLFLSIGEIIWFFYDFILNTDPFPSIADLFFLLSYPLINIAIIKQIKITEQKFSLKNKIIITLIFILLSIIFIIPLLKNLDPKANALENIFNTFYVFGDIILIISSILVLFIIKTYRKGKLATSWKIFLFAPISMLLADFLFTFFGEKYELGGVYYVLIDMLWLLAFSLYSYSISHFIINVKEIRDKYLK